MKVVSVSLAKEKLLALPETERSFFLALGQVTNEINALTKMLYWAAGTPGTTGAEGDGRFAMMLLLIRLLAGKLNEAWEMFQKNYFAAPPSGVALSKHYDPMLEGEPAKAMQCLKVYFSSHNAAHEIRNRFAFHYSPPDVSAALSRVSEPLLLYLDRDSAPNNLFHLCEVLLSEALLTALHAIGGPASLPALVDQLFEVSLWFAQASDGLMDAIIESNGLELRAAEPQEIHFPNLLDFRSVALPWFTETKGAVDSLADSP